MTWTATSGVALVHKAWAATRRPPLEVIDFKLRDQVALALQTGQQPQVQSEPSMSEGLPSEGSPADGGDIQGMMGGLERQ